MVRCPGYSFGLDTRLGENTLGGFTMSRFTGKTDYEREGASGRQQINVTSVNPYFGLKKSEYSVWSFVGAGSGELEVEQDFVSGVSTSDLSLNTLGVGASGEVWRSARTTLHLTGEITVTELSVDGSDTIDAVKVGANRSRMILSASQRYQMDRGGYVEPKFEFGVAHDSGDGSTGSRLEIGAGMYYLSPSQRISMSLSSYSLVERNNYSEWGVEAGIRMLPGARSVACHSVCNLPTAQRYEALIGFGSPAERLVTRWMMKYIVLDSTQILVLEYLLLEQRIVDTLRRSIS